MEDKINNLIKALSDFQEECPVIHQGSEGHNYTYSSLKDIFKIIIPLLKKNGLVFTQLVGENCIDTVLFHIESGEEMSTTTYIPQGVQLRSMNDFQVLGSAITYIRRYAISAMLGIITDKDTDAKGDQVDKVPRLDKKKQDDKEGVLTLPDSIYKEAMQLNDVEVLRKFVTEWRTKPKAMSEVQYHQLTKLGKSLTM